MKVELKRIEHSERLSEETNAFSADLYINGKKAGVTSNRGHGGPTVYRPYNPEGSALIKEAEEWCKKLPPKRYPATESMEAFSLDMNLEHYIDDLLENRLKQQLQKKMTNSFKQHIVVSDDPEFSYRGYQLSHPIEVILARPDGQKILTSLLNNIKPNLKGNEKILNTNIPEEILKAAGLNEDQYVKWEKGKQVKKSSSQKKGRKI